MNGCISAHVLSENLDFCHERLGVCSRWLVFDDSNDFLLGSDEWLDVCFLIVGCAPDGDVSDEVWVYVGEVQVLECMRAE